MPTPRQTSAAKHSTTSRKHRDFIEILDDRTTASGKNWRLPVDPQCKRHGALYVAAEHIWGPENARGTESQSDDDNGK